MLFICRCCYWAVSRWDQKLHKVLMWLWMRGAFRKRNCSIRQYRREIEVIRRNVGFRNRCFLSFRLWTICCDYSLGRVSITSFCDISIILIIRFILGDMIIFIYFLRWSILFPACTILPKFDHILLRFILL